MCLCVFHGYSLLRDDRGGASRNSRNCHYPPQIGSMYIFPGQGLTLYTSIKATPMVSFFPRTMAV
jgi:hypothetical protein